MLFRSDRKSTRLNSSHLVISYAVFCLKKKKKKKQQLLHRLHTEPRHTVTQRHVTSTTIGLPFCALLVSCCHSGLSSFFVFFFFNDTATTEIYTLSLHDALPI